ncbi:PTS system, cellobiose-specific IIC component [Spiroplasma helicoides]|uniref:PTS system, cellobiose-specific IIC component n=1 Tax=Spiroplasma helicoides TaxID=216938 RepID=A0A1B3SJP8_9MOLU|nr:PTS transporter subunit EIIC [Spiroplasma helicoides]AOG60148.1 PTS system, cellobiose-specific IIC component [Spiroplasma helicoides]
MGTNEIVNRPDSKAKAWFKNKFIPAMGKLGSQTHLASMRDAFGTLLPLTITGSLGLILGSIVFAGGGSGYVSVLGLFVKIAHPELSNDAITKFIQNPLNEGWYKTFLIGATVFNNLNTITIGMTSIWFSFVFGYYISLNRNLKTPVIGGFASTMGFLATTMGNIGFYQGAAGLIGAIIFGAISTEIFVKLSSVRALYIKLPDGVPPSVSKSFAVFLPFMLTLLIMAAGNLIFIIPAYIDQETFRVHASENSKIDSAEGWLAWINQYGAINDDTTKFWDAAKAGNWSNFSQIDAVRDAFQAAAKQGTDDEKIRYLFEHLKDIYGNLGSKDQQSLFSSLMTVMSGVDAGKVYSFDSGATSAFIGNVENINELMMFNTYSAVSVNYDQFGLSAAVYQFFVTFLLTFAQGSQGGLALALAYAFFISFLWFFGVHGSNVVNGAFLPIWSMMFTINSTLVAQLGYDQAVLTGQMGVFASPIFDCFMNLGGSGASFALILGTLVFSRRQDNKKICIYSTAPGVFQINEPITFGFPLVLNGVYFAPFVAAPMVNIFMAWLFSPQALNLVGYAAITVPWTTPFWIAGPLTYYRQGGWAFVLTIINLAISFGIYFPFILIDNSRYFKKIRIIDMEEYQKQMRFFRDPYFKATVKLEDKVERIKAGGEYAYGNAEAQNRFWENKLSNSAILDIRKNWNLAIADAKVAFYDFKADRYKEMGESKNLVKQEAWEQPRRINELKYELAERMMDDKDHTINKQTEKAALKEQIKAIKAEFVSKKESIKSVQQSKLATYKQVRAEKMSAIASKKAEFKTKAAEIKAKYSAELAQAKAAAKAAKANN